LINFHLLAANFQMNLIVGRRDDCEFMNENKHDCVSLEQRLFSSLRRGRRFQIQGFETESLPGYGVVCIVCILNTAAVENTVGTALGGIMDSLIEWAALG
jgi:hypothetical protein